MQHSTSRQLQAYWERVRKGRAAPRRSEIDPAAIAPLLPDIFIAECDGSGFGFRLAGTRICERFGRELRGADLLGLWESEDREGVAALFRRVISEAAIGQILFNAYAEAGRQAKFELVVMPLIHGGHKINRLLGAISALEPPFWLGAEPLVRQELTELQLLWPHGDARARPAPASVPADKSEGAEPLASPGAPRRRRFRVYRGGGGH